MNDPIEFYRIKDSANPEFAGCMQIYHEAFPPYERQADEVISGRVDDDSCLLLAGRAEGEIVCMSLLWEFQQTPYIFLDYFAVKTNTRGYQVGTRFLRFILSNFLDSGKFLVMEVEHPDYGANREDRARRVRFYEKNGGVILQNLRYFLPPLGGAVKPLEMQLMILPEPVDPPDEDAIQNMIRLIYKKVYQIEYINAHESGV
jgi:GNAT superfamily N-acetyltransferase